jgi:hypothetical protein
VPLRLSSEASFSFLRNFDTHWPLFFADVRSDSLTTKVEDYKKSHCYATDNREIVLCETLKLFPMSRIGSPASRRLIASLT